MKSNSLGHFLAAIASFICAPVFAEDAVTQYNLNELDWLAGQWIDTRDDTTVIEVQWNEVAGDSMIGTWRKTRNDTLVAYEILTMREINGEIVYRFDLYTIPEGSETFDLASTLRLRMLDAKEDEAHFEIIDEENWVLTIDVSDGFLRGWMDDSNNPSSERRYNYYAKKQAPM